MSVCVFVVESDEKENHDDDDDDDGIDLSVFNCPTLPVTCGSGSGILHKYRFATGVWVGIFLTLMTTNVKKLYVGHKCFTFINTMAPKSLSTPKMSDWCCIRYNYETKCHSTI